MKKCVLSPHVRRDQRVDGKLIFRSGKGIGSEIVYTKTDYQIIGKAVDAHLKGLSAEEAVDSVENLIKSDRTRLIWFAAYTAIKMANSRK